MANKKTPVLDLWGVSRTSVYTCAQTPAVPPRLAGVRPLSLWRAITLLPYDGGLRRDFHRLAAANTASGFFAPSAGPLCLPATARISAARTLCMRLCRFYFRLIGFGNTMRLLEGSLRERPHPAQLRETKALHVVIAIRNDPQIVGQTDTRRPVLARVLQFDPRFVGQTCGEQLR